MRCVACFGPLRASVVATTPACAGPALAVAVAAAAADSDADSEAPPKPVLPYFPRVMTPELFWLLKTPNARYRPGRGEDRG